jgi:hypothetical protein
MRPDKRVSTVSTTRWGVKSGPRSEGRSSSSPEPELPGDFVSDDLRADCARFLDELRERVQLRRERPDEATRLPDEHID